MNCCLVGSLTCSVLCLVVVSRSIPQAVGVEQDDKGAIKVNELSQTGVPGIWAIGDVTNRVNLTPVALMEGMAFAKTCFGGVPTQPDYQNIASAVFCQPPLASVG